MSRDRVFLVVLGGLLGFMLLMGIGAIVLSIIREPSQELALKIVGGLGSMFASVVALVLGYLVGRNGRNGEAKP